MTITLVQSNLYKTDLDADAVATFATPVANNLLIALGKGTNAITNASITGWTPAISGKYIAATSKTIAIFYKISAGNEGAITLNWTSSTLTSLSLMEWSGLSLTPLDQTAKVDSNDSGVTSRSAGTTGTLAQADELVIACVGMGAVCSALSWSNSFTDRATGQANFYGSSLVVSATTAVETTASWTTSVYAGGCIATFKGLAAGIAIPVLLNQYRRRRE